MRYHALVTDYDYTIADHGLVNPETIEALKKVRSSGRKVLLVTGRQLADLLRVFPEIQLFDRVVAENGAVLYRPATREERLLAEPPPPEFVQALRETGMVPLSEGKIIVATHRPNETTILEVIRDLGLELQVAFNHDAVMVLPSGTNKASGLQAAMAELGLSVHNCVAVGDAENDHAFVSVAECSVAVANALDALKKRVDYVVHGEIGEGVIELTDQLIDSDLQFLQPVLRQHIALGMRSDSSEVFVDPYGHSVLITGTSGSGKSTLATTFIEKLAELNYQFCIIDPEGDYIDIEGAVALGDSQRPPTVPEAMEVLNKPGENVILNLLGIALPERPIFFESLLHRIHELRGRTGRPHWLVIDETHHVLPSTWKPAGPTLREGGMGLMMITVAPEELPRTALELPDLVVAVGENPGQTLQALTNAVGSERPAPTETKLETGEGLGWFWKTGGSPFWFRGFPTKGLRHRHRRKYAEGELGPELSFYFRGPEQKLNLRAQNLSIFLQLADGVDDATWLFHLRQGDISRWIRDAIKDPELAAEIQNFENDSSDAAESKAYIRTAVEKRYILAA